MAVRVPAAARQASPLPPAQAAYADLKASPAQIPETAPSVRQMQLAAVPDGAGAVEQIEGICLTAAAELRRQGLSRTTDSFLQAHAEEIMQQITDPVLRRAHIMEE